MPFYLLLDSATHRVIRFADQAIEAVEANTYLGQTLELPDDMNAKNCWKFRFYGGVLQETGPGGLPPVGTAAVLRDSKYELRKTVIDKAQREFHRKVPLTALAYIATLDAARKWLADQPLEPIELRFVPSRERAEEFIKTHYDNLERTLEFYVPMTRKLDAIDRAKDAAELEKIVP